jgi:hypothetical protein
MSEGVGVVVMDVFVCLMPASVNGEEGVFIYLSISPHLTSPHLTSTRLASHTHFPPSLQYPNPAHHTTPHTPSRRTVPRTTPSSTPPVIHRSSNLASPCFACPCTRLPADRPRNSPRLKRQGRGGVLFGCLRVVIGRVWRRGGDWLHESARTCGGRGCLGLVSEGTVECLEGSVESSAGRRGRDIRMGMGWGKEIGVRRGAVSGALR